MAAALLAGLLREPAPPAVVIAEPQAERRARLEALFPWVRVVAENWEAARAAGTLILAVKPQVMPEAVAELRPALSHRPLIVSIAAGVTTARLARWLGEDQAIVRAMPNTPALMGSGATGLFANARVDARGRERAEHLMRSVGVVVWLEDEAELDAVTALSGSGPAYAFALMEAMEAAGIELGLQPETARLLTLQTVFGAARLALESEDGPARLREQVTSPGGTTQAALEVFARAGFQRTVGQAIKAAAARARELAEDKA